MANKNQMLVMHRDQFVTSVIGYNYNFKKGVPLMVVGEMVQECMRQGAVPPEGAEVQEDPSARPSAAPRGAEREEQIETAIQNMVDRNSRDDFGASGAPNLRALEQAVGFKVDKKERDTIWAAINKSIHEVGPE